MSNSAAPIPLIVTNATRSAARSRSYVSHAKIISSLTLLSKILGIARESVMARYFGAMAVSSAFTVAFKAPNLFRKLLGEGALSAAFIPLYSHAEQHDPAEANRFAANSVNLLAMILLSLTVVGELALWIAGHWLHLRGQNMLIVHFTAIMLPYVLLVCGTAFLGGILQVHHRFALPSIAPILLNLIHIGVIVIGARMLGLAGAQGDREIALQTRLGYWLCVFVLVAGALQILILLPALRAVGFRFMWIGNVWTPAVKKMLRLSFPVAMSAGVLQLSVVIDLAITVKLTGGEDPQQKLHLFGLVLNYPLRYGAVVRLNWAQTLYQFPLGVFAIALATAIFPRLSADAPHKDATNLTAFKNILRHGMILSLLEGLPASVGLILVRYPAIRLLFESGKFTSADTRLVAASLVFYSAAIWVFGLQQILNRAYYALHDTMTPMVMSLVTIVINTLVEIPLCFSRLGEAGMAAGTCASFVAQAVVMLLILDRRTGGIGLRAILAQAGKMLMATAAMAIGCLAVQQLPAYPRGDNHLESLIQLIILMTTGGSIYAATCLALGLKSVLRTE